MNSETTVEEMGARIERLERGARTARSWKRAALVAIVVALSAPYTARALDPVPRSFAAGDVISASEMNENFAYLEDAITALESRLPAGTVALFDLSTCPKGWTELTEARGRALVGLDGAAGTLRGAVGDPLDNREDREHAHEVDIDAFEATASGAHNHQWLNGATLSYGANGQVGPSLNSNLVQAGASVVIYAPVNSGNANYFTDNEPAHTHSIAPPVTASSAARTSSVIPYVQLLVCRRS